MALTLWRRSWVSGSRSGRWRRVVLRGVAVVALPALLLLAVWAGRVLGGRTLVAGRATVLVGGWSASGADALDEGPVTVVSGCLGIGSGVVVWPHGTTVVGRSPVTVHIPNLGTFAEGEQVHVGGSPVATAGGHPPGKAFDVAGVTVPAACAGRDVFVAGPIPSK